MNDNEIYKIIENIIKNTKIIQTMYQDCIDLAKDSFKDVERKFVVRLIKEVDNYLQEFILKNEIDYIKDIKGQYYEVVDICRYEDWPEFNEYCKYIDDPFYDGGLNISKFVRNSLTKYKFPVEYIFDYYDNGWLRYKVADFMSSEKGGKTLGSLYEDYI